MNETFVAWCRHRVNTVCKYLLFGASLSSHVCCCFVKGKTKIESHSNVLLVRFNKIYYVSLQVPKESSFASLQEFSERCYVTKYRQNNMFINSFYFHVKLLNT